MRKIQEVKISPIKGNKTIIEEMEIQVNKTGTKLVIILTEEDTKVTSEGVEEAYNSGQTGAEGHQD